MRAILTYHSIDESGSPISIDPRVFRSHMEFLAAGHPRVVPLADIASGKAPDESLALTFDDAFANFHEHAFPILTDLDLPATVFVVSDHVGGQNDWAAPGLVHGSVPLLPLMSWEQLATLAERGVEVGAHTRRHPRLTGLSPAALADEIDGAAERLEDALQTRPTTFAYPFGDVNHAVREAVGRTYACACTTELRALSHVEDNLLLPRLDAYYFRSHGQLEQWGSSAFQRRLWFRAQARRVRRLVTSAAVHA